MNVTAVVDTSGAVVERYAYDPYGQVTILNGADGADPDVDGETVFEWDPDADGVSDVDNRTLYAGYHFDTETGLYSVRHRYYHPTLGRWLSRDPSESTRNFYEAVMSAPTIGLDPLGLEMIRNRLWVQAKEDFTKQTGTGLQWTATTGPGAVPSEAVTLAQWNISWGAEVRCDPQQSWFASAPQGGEEFFPGSLSETSLRVDKWYTYSGSLLTGQDWNQVARDAVGKFVTGLSELVSQFKDWGKVKVQVGTSSGSLSADYGNITMMGSAAGGGAPSGTPHCTSIWIPFTLGKKALRLTNEISYEDPKGGQHRSTDLPNVRKEIRVGSDIESTFSVGFRICGWCYCTWQPGEQNGQKGWDYDIGRMVVIEPLYQDIRAETATGKGAVSWSVQGLWGPIFGGHPTTTTNKFPGWPAGARDFEIKR